MEQTTAVPQTPQIPEKTEKSSNKILVVLISFVLILILMVAGIAGFLVYKEFKNNTKPTGNTVTDTSTQPGSPSGTDTVVTPPVTPPAPPTPPTTASPCTSAPVVSSFIATPNSVVSGNSSTLTWEITTSSDVVTLDQGIGDVTTVSSKVVTPASTTTYTLTASCAGMTTTKQATVTVTAPPPAAPSFTVTGVTTTVSPSNFSGTCPKTFNFTSKITTNGSGTVTYVWEKSNGVTSANQTLTFDSASQKTVTDSWEISSTKTGWERVKIISPNSLTSDKANFTGTCETVEDFSGFWYHNFGTMNISQTGNMVTGTYINSMAGTTGTISGTVAGNTMTGTWSRPGASGNLTWTISGGNKIDGNWGAAGKWCGAKSGVSFPSGCGFAGSWKGKLSAFPSCDMSLTLKGTTVTGTYCNGTVSGSLSYSGGYTVVSGNWTTGIGTTGPFHFYMNDYNSLRFQGNYNATFEWCGYRSGSSAPSPCLK